MSAKISIPGGNGRMGKTLIKEIIENENLQLANSNCLPNDKEKGLVLDPPSDRPVYAQCMI